MGKYDFDLLNRQLMGRILSLVEKWAPGGHIKSGRYHAKNPTRADREIGSFSVNLKTGQWADFAVPDARGGDLISLYAYLNNTTNKQAYFELQYLIGSK